MKAGFHQAKGGPSRWRPCDRGLDQIPELR